MTGRTIDLDSPLLRGSGGRSVGTTDAVGGPGAATRRDARVELARCRGKARYLPNLLVAIWAAQDPQRQRLIADVPEDFWRHVKASPTCK